MRETIRFLLEVGWHCVDMGGRKILLPSGARMDIAERDQRIEIAGAAQFQEKEGSLRNAIAAAKKGRLFLELDGESSGLLDAKHLPALEGVWEEEILVIAKGKVGDLLPLLDRKELAALKLWKNLLEHWKEDGFEAVALEDRFQGTLLAYQQKGVEWLSFLQKKGFSALLSDEMGAW